VNILALDLAARTGWARARGLAGSPREVESGELENELPEDAHRELCYRQGLRLLRFGDWVREQVGGGGCAPWLVAYERPLAHARGLSAVAAAHQYEGVLLRELARLRVPHVSVNVATLKKHATGDGRAKKPQMIEAARRRWGLRADGAELGHDQADALCVLAWTLDSYLGEPA
jgi:hypothetical protein